MRINERSRFRVGVITIHEPGILNRKRCIAGYPIRIRLNILVSNFFCARLMHKINNTRSRTNNLGTA